MLAIQDLIEWRPNRLSEDHLTNFAREFFKDELQWHVSYHNPPSGSWKELTLVHDGKEYLQEIHKRGVGRMKRPDLVAQYIGGAGETTTLLLFESKQDQSSWESALPEMLENFFEGADDYNESAGIRNVPFWHYRHRDEKIWERLEEDDEERTWMQRADVSYVFGFGYLLGVRPPTNLTSEIEWMEEQLEEYEVVPPIILAAVGWKPETFEPFVLTVYSKTFPHQLKEHLETILPTVNEGNS